jgi:protein SCO1/2
MLWDPASAHDGSHHERLPAIKPAPDFTLTTQDHGILSLGDLRGKAAAITFIYTSCLDSCPMLTHNMAQVRDSLGPLFGARIAFVTITVDPERDTPERLREYAESFDANRDGWTFLTGEPTAVRDVGRKFGIAIRKVQGGGVEHTFLTSLVDPHGILRVQYLGVRFDLEEFRRDLLSLLDDAK